MTELKTFDFTGAMGRGLALGQGIRQQQNQGKLAALLGQARTTSGPQRDALMGQVYGVDPAAGMAAEQQMGKLDEMKAKRLGQMASIFTSVDPQQRAAMWPTIRQELSQIIPGAQYPEMWDESLLPQAQAIAQQLGGLAGAEAFTLGPGSKRFGPDGRVIAEVPFAPERPDYIFQTDAEGNGYWIPKPTGAPQSTGAPAPTTGGGGQVLDSAYQSGLGFDPLRDAVEYHESRGNPNAVSPKGAMGRMQTMPGTLRDPGFGIQPARDQSDAEMTRVGNEYLQAMLQKYGSPELALAAYNWGPGNVDQALQQSGGDPTRVLASAPQETQQYVRNVLSTAGGQGGSARPQAAPGGAIPIPGFRAAPKAGSASFTPMTAEEVTALGFPEGTVAQRNTATGAIQVLSKPAGMTPLQAASQAVKQQKAEQAQQDALATYDDSLQTLDTLLAHPGFDDLGTIEGDLKTNVPLIRTEAKGANAILETIKAQVLINTLGKLKALSATGASGFGALNQSEGDALRASIANLDTAQSHADLKRAVMRIRQVMERSRNIIAGTQVDFGRQGQPDAAPSNGIDPRRRALLDKY